MSAQDISNFVGTLQTVMAQTSTVEADQATVDGDNQAIGATNATLATQTTKLTTDTDTLDADEVTLDTAVQAMEAAYVNAFPSIGTRMIAARGVSLDEIEAISMFKKLIGGIKERIAARRAKRK